MDGESSVLYGNPTVPQCIYCGRTNGVLDVDHVIPRCRATRRRRSRASSSSPRFAARGPSSRFSFATWPCSLEATSIRITWHASATTTCPASSLAIEWPFASCTSTGAVSPTLDAGP